MLPSDPLLLPAAHPESRRSTCQMILAASLLKPDQRLFISNGTKQARSISKQSLFCRASSPRRIFLWHLLFKNANQLWKLCAKDIPAEMAAAAVTELTCYVGACLSLCSLFGDKSWVLPRRFAWFAMSEKASYYFVSAVAVASWHSAPGHLDVCGWRVEVQKTLWLPMPRPCVCFAPQISGHLVWENCLSNRAASTKSCLSIWGRSLTYWQQTATLQSSWHPTSWRETAKALMRLTTGLPFCLMLFLWAETEHTLRQDWSRDPGHVYPPYRTWYYQISTFIQFWNQILF